MARREMVWFTPNLVNAQCTAGERPVYASKVLGNYGFTYVIFYLHLPVITLL